MQGSRMQSRLAMAATAILLLANVIVPLVWGDVYPFTSAPMFRDAPTECCNYQVLTGEGEAMPTERWLCQRVYDGNPIGYGVGLRPPAVIEQQFGVIHDEAAIRGHFQPQLAEPHYQSHNSIEVVQQVLGPIDGQHVGVMRTNRWRIWLRE